MFSNLKSHPFQFYLKTFIDFRRFKNDFENLQVSKNIMRKDLYDEAVNDLLEKIDITLKDKKTKK